ncbi:MAG: hypothetical protein CMN55_07980 [Sneathiella sp.]|jgi:hypothetical protein|uniref:hypothetical protein n=1 Tax=Sneathiella sp. TaxID=1964365 RepID=UPI000C65154F|nr:hypothetical protein [Sneathiella sp.]MAL79040.1 hypothetical protein [Sneathiella sp.]|tara:strand:- start:54 stop:326 length:273 start_codon:yes stop_codon:yes gene_type:complete
MDSSTISTSPAPEGLSASCADPIINPEDVKWAARRYILIYGEEAPDVAQSQVTHLDQQGKIRVAEMFDRIRHECARLLKQSEKLLIHPIN